MIPSTIPPAAIDLILEEEGIDQPSKWPGGESGISLGYGCDIGADPASLEFWRGVLTDDEVARLGHARGVTGSTAQAIAHKFADIHVTKEQALRVFMDHTLPTEIAKTAIAFPGSEYLPPAAFGALVSLVFNRGPALGGPRRTEMKAIHDAILNSKADPGETETQRVNALLEFISAQFLEMRRLWAGQGLDGLVARRKHEALLIRSAIV